MEKFYINKLREDVLKFTKARKTMSWKVRKCEFSCRDNLTFTNPTIEQGLQVAQDEVFQI